MNQHAGDCTIYASLSNGCPTDGICTCGYAGYKDRSQNVAMHDLYSEERLIEMKNRPQPNTGESMSFEEWTKTEGYNQFCKWWNSDGKRYIGKMWCSDMLAGDAWKKSEETSNAEIDRLKAKLKVAIEALEGTIKYLKQSRYSNDKLWDKIDESLAAIDEKGNV